MTDIVERFAADLDGIREGRRQSVTLSLAVQVLRRVRELEGRVETAERDAEQWQVRCAGCLTAAEGHTANPAREGDYGWTLAYQRTLELRQTYDALRARLMALAERWEAEAGRTSLVPGTGMVERFRRRAAAELRAALEGRDG